MNFWQEFQKLLLELPVRDMGNTNCNDFYGDNSNDSDNCYMCFSSGRLTNCSYVYDSGGCTDCMDLDFTGESEGSFMGFAYKCNNSSYFFDCSNLTNCHYCFRCGTCQDCFGCVGLDNQQYCFFNRKMDKDTYEKTVAHYSGTHSVDQTLAELKTLAENYPMPPNNVSPRSDANSDYADDSFRVRNIYMSFNIADSQNVLYSYFSSTLTDCADMSHCGKCDNCYNCVAVDNSASTFHSFFSGRLLDCVYCYYCDNCQNCIGCAGLSGKRYCVLNRQVSEEKYKEIREKILQNPNAEIEL